MQIKISNKIKEKIVRLHIEPNYEQTVIESIQLIKYFRRFGIAFETVSKFLVGVGSIVSFAAGIYKSKIMSFVSGTVSVISLVFLQYATFSIKESKRHTAELNVILKNLNLQQIPGVETGAQDYDKNKINQINEINEINDYEDTPYNETPTSLPQDELGGKLNGNLFSKFLHFIFRK